MKFYKLKVSFGSLALKDVSTSDIYQEEKSLAQEVKYFS